MYRKLAIGSAAITIVIGLGYCSLAFIDPESQFGKDYGYTIGLLSLPFVCLIAPGSSVLTIVFTILAFTEKKRTNAPQPSEPQQASKDD